MQKILYPFFTFLAFNFCLPSASALTIKTARVAEQKQASGKQTEARQEKTEQVKTRQAKIVVEPSLPVPGTPVAPILQKKRQSRATGEQPVSGITTAQAASRATASAPTAEQKLTTKQEPTPKGLISLQYTAPYLDQNLGSFSQKINREEHFTGHTKTAKQSKEHGLGVRDQVFTANIDWSNDLADTEQPPEPFQKVSIDSTIDKTPGLNLNFGARLQNFVITSNYAQAVEVSGFSEFLSRDTESEAKIWNNELAYTTDWMAREVVFALGYQKAIESAHLDVPSERYSTKSTLFLSKGTLLSLEYYQDKDNMVHKADEGADEQGIITRLGFTF